jgi:hypothetical protein
VVFAVHRDHAGPAFDHCGGIRKCYDGSTAQQPDEPGFVVSRQPSIVRRRIVRDPVQPKQIASRQRGSRTAPSGEKSTAVFNSLLPEIELDLVRAPSLQRSEGICKTWRGATKATKVGMRLTGVAIRSLWSLMSRAPSSASACFRMSKYFPMITIQWHTEYDLAAAGGSGG